MQLFPRSLLVALILFVTAVLPARAKAAPVQAEVIRAFDVQIRLLPDTTLDVIETIKMDFGKAQRHGIYRVIPVRYSRIGFKLPNVTIGLKLKSVTDEQGKPWAFKAKTQGNDFNLKIGDANRLITGVHIYRIHYLVQRAVKFINGVAEVYWNATGNEWPFMIRRASARFYPPRGIAPQKIRTASYVGALGSTRQGQIAVLKDCVLYSASALAPGEGLTVKATLPKGAVKAPRIPA